MARSTTPAQRAAQITFVLKGHLKNVQIPSLAALRRRAAAFETLRPEVLADPDSALGRLNAACGALARAVRLANPRGIRLAALGGKSLPG